METYFSPNFLVSSILLPLRHFFSQPQVPDHVRWHEDPKHRKIEIAQANDIIRNTGDARPRVILNRGGYVISKVGLTDNLAQGRNIAQTKGLKDIINMVLINGQSSIVIDSPSLGECELLADMVSHFLVWTRPVLCGSQGFKDFALPMQISDVALTREEKELFQVQISFPWIKEEEWSVKTDALKIKDIFLIQDLSTG
jgi:hypothetical protein